MVFGRRVLRNECGVLDEEFRFNLALRHDLWSDEKVQEMLKIPLPSNENLRRIYMKDI